MLLNQLREITGIQDPSFLHEALKVGFQYCLSQESQESTVLPIALCLSELFTLSLKFTQGQGLYTFNSLVSSTCELWGVGGNLWEELHRD